MATLTKSIRPQLFVAITAIFALLALLLNSLLSVDVPLQRSINYVLFLFPFGCSLFLLIKRLSKTGFSSENGLIYCITLGFCLYLLAIIFHILTQETSVPNPTSTAIYHWIRLASFLFNLSMVFHSHSKAKGNAAPQVITRYLDHDRSHASDNLDHLPSAN